MKRRIPHDFQSKTAIMGHRCHQCSKAIGSGKKYLKCSTCEYACHPACLDQAPEDCGATPVKQVANRPLTAG